MKKTEMLKKNYEFRNVMQRGKYYSGNFIEAFVLKNNKQKNYLGIAVSTKIGKAVTRNKIKRLIREGYRKIEEETTNGFSIVFLWKKAKSTEFANYENVSNDIFRILKKSQIIEEKYE